MKTTQTVRLLLSGVATIALMTPAMALEAQAFVDRVAEVYKTIGYDLSFGEATLDGDTVTVDGVTITFPTGAEIEPIEFTSEITFSGVTEETDGAYKVASLTIPDVDTTFEEGGVEGHVTLSDIRADGLWFPAGDTVPAIAILQLVQSLSTGPLSLEREGEEVFSLESIRADYTFNPPEQGLNLVDLSSKLHIAGLSLDLSSVGEEDPSAAATIEALGLTTVNGEITQNFSWTMADGHIVMDEFLLDFADVGALNTKLDIVGLTPAVLDQIYAMQAEAMAAAGGELTEEQSQAQMMQGMALAQGISIGSASVRYDDASLAGKLLDLFAEQQGIDRATFVDALKSGLPAMLAGTGIPALNDIVIPPVEAFLDDPQSLEVKIAPSEPTPVLALAAAAANPASLITVLGLVVEANKAE